jgi:Aspartyl protease
VLRRAGIYHCFLGLSLMLCAPAVLADGCRLQRIVAVDLLVTNAGRVQIPVEINGVHVQMGIEAGSGLSGIWSGATAALGLKPKETIALGALRAGGTPLTQTVHIDSFKIGNTRWPPFSVVVYPRNQQFPQSLSEDDVVGVLGQDVFSSVDLELDFGAHQLRLYSQKHCPGQVVYWARQYDVLPLKKNALGNLFISMAVNGKLVSTSMSTMNSISTIEEEAAKRILGADRTSDTGGSDGCSYCRSITLKAQGLEIRNSDVNIVNSVWKDCRLSVPKSESGVASYDCLGAFPLRLGLNVLSKLHLYYANGEKKLYFTDARVNAANAITEPTSSVATQQ